MRMDRICGMKYPVLLVIVAHLLAGAAGFAHHSFAAEFDMRKPFKLTGIVTKVEWTSPHSFFYLDVKDPASNRVAMWACELGSPNSLVSRGWTRDALKVGMTVNLSGNLARDRSHKVLVREINVDGKTLEVIPLR